MGNNTLKSFGNFENLINFYGAVIKHCLLREKKLKIHKSKVISVIKYTFNFSN